MKKRTFSVSKLVSPYEPKKQKVAGTLKFLSGIGNTRKSFTVTSDERDAQKKPKEPPKKVITIRIPTAKDYENVPDDYVPGRPLLPWRELQKVLSLMKRLHDWYMRASAAGIDTISVSIPPEVFITERHTIMFSFEDIHLMFRLRRLDVQLMTVWCL